MIENVWVQFLLVLFGSALALATGLIVWSVQERNRREEEERNTVAALVVEMANLRQAVDKRFSFWTKDVREEIEKKAPETRWSWLHPLVPFSADVFSHLASRLGSIDSRVASQLVKYHGFRQFVNDFQDAKDQYVAAGRAEEFYRTYLFNLLRLIRRGEEFASTVDRVAALSEEAIEDSLFRRTAVVPRTEWPAVRSLIGAAEEADTVNTILQSKLDSEGLLQRVIDS